MPFRAQLDPAGKNRKEAEETALTAEIEVNDAKREVAEKKYIEDRHEAPRSAAEAAEDARENAKLKSKSARKGQKKLFAALEKHPRFGFAAAVETEFKPRADSPSSLSVATSDISSTAQLDTPSSPEFLKTSGSDGDLMVSTKPVTDHSNAVNTETSKASRLPVQKHNKTVASDRVPETVRLE